MAQTVSNLCNTIPLYKSFTNKYLGNPSYVNAKCPQVGMVRPTSSSRGKVVKAMANNHRRDNLDHLQRPSNVKRREPSSAPIGLWDRFPTARTIQQMMDTMDRIMEEPFAFNSQLPSTLPNEGGGYARGRTPWEIKEGESEYKMRFDMPGMTKEDVKLWVEDQMLIIKAEKVPKTKLNGQENGAMEEEEGEWSAKSYGKYGSRIALPEHVDYEKIKAEVKDGVLYITIPKASTSSKIFDIKVE